MSHELLTIVVTPRDRLSTTPACLRHLFDNTPQPFELIVPMSGVPEHLQKRLLTEYGNRARFIFKSELMNQAQLRNIALRDISTRLTAFVDTDVFVRPGWLEPLLACEAETGAVLVQPLILDRNELIHTAGNDFFLTYENGKAYGTMELHFAHQRVAAGGTNLKRRDIDYAEVHCELTVTETIRSLEIFDENLRECHELDGGMTLKKAGCRMVFEPKSHVYLFYPEMIDTPEDAVMFAWKWDMKAMLDGFHYFQDKWNINLNYKGGFEGFMRYINRRVGFFSRRWPSPTAIKLDFALLRLKKILRRGRGTGVHG